MNSDQFSEHFPFGCICIIIRMFRTTLFDMNGGLSNENIPAFNRFLRTLRQPNRMQHREHTTLGPLVHPAARRLAGGHDFFVHVLTHKDTLRPPMRTIAWFMVTTVLAAYPGYLYGWQIAILLFCQGWWDSSWHAADYHRPNGLPQSPSDHDWIRWAAPMAALTTVMVPIFLH